MPRPKRGWYLVRKLTGGYVELIAGPYTSKAHTWQVYATLIDQHRFGDFLPGSTMRFFTAAEIDRWYDKIIDRRQEFA